MVKRVVVTGGAGQIAYNLLFRIAAGELLGKEEPIVLQILEVPAMYEALKGVVMELEDCAFPLLQGIKIGSDPYEIFEGVNYALLVGSKPRGPGMERKDLLVDNAKIFVEQGKALNAAAASDVLVHVVGNPCNTNCLIAMRHAPKISPSQFFAMTRLDENRAKNMVAKKAGVDVASVTNMAIWGNHSSTLVADATHAKVQGKSVFEKIKDRAWLEHPFVEGVQKRGAAVIAARGKSSAASAAHAILDSVRSLIAPTPKGEWFSVAKNAEDNPYGINRELIFSFPCISKGQGKIEIVKGLEWTPFLQEKITITEAELLEEKRAALG